VDRVLGFGFARVRGTLIVVAGLPRAGAGYDTIWGRWPPHLDHKSRTYPFINASSDALVQALAGAGGGGAEAAKADDADSSEADASPRRATAARGGWKAGERHCASTPEVLALATSLAAPRLDEADAARAGALASCGSTLECGLALDGEGRIARIGAAAQASGCGAGGLRRIMAGRARQE
jgi:hypothetical protein